MGDLIIVVEGKEDENFIRQLVQLRIETSKSIQFIHLGTNARSIGEDLKTTILIQTNSFKIPTIFIVDADKELSDGQKGVKKVFEVVDDPEIFMIPDNRNEGNLETLLRKIIPNEYAPLLTSCIDGFADCVNGLSLEEYNVNEKAKFFIYHSGLTNDNPSGTKRLYDSPYYNLNADVLDPLVNFLKMHLQ